MTPVTISWAEVTNTEVLLRWSDASYSLTGGSNVEVERYHIWYQLNDQPFAHLTTENNGVNEFLHNGLIGGNIYRYKIMIETYLGESETFSDVTEIQTAQAPEQP